MAEKSHKGTSLKSKPEDISKRIVKTAKSGDFTKVCELLNHYPDVDISTTDELGQTLLHHVAKAGNVIALMLCLNKKPDVNHADKAGMSALHLAAMRGHTRVIQTLLQHGADVNLAAKETGTTALHLAASRNLAATRNDRRAVEALISHGADVTAIDSQGRTAMDLCKNKAMLKEMQDVVTMIQETGEVTLETAEISTHGPTRFQHLGLIVSRKVDETDKKEPVKPTPVSTRAKPVLSKLPSDLRLVVPDNSFSMTCRRHKQGHSEVDFGIKDNEDICSAVFYYRLGRVDPGDRIVAAITVPLMSKPSAREELVMKTDTQQEYVVDDIKVNAAGKCFGTVEFDLTSFKSIVIVSRPTLEAFKASTEATTLRSSVDDRVELDIPKGTFKLDTKITLEIIEPAATSGEDGTATSKGDIVSTSAFYSLESGGTALSKPVTMQIPLPAAYSGGGDILLFSMNKPVEEETPDSWQVLDVTPSVVGNSVKFDVTSFSIKVAIEAGSRLRSSMSSATPHPVSPSTPDSDMTSFASLVSIQSQISRMFRRARRTEFTVSFVCMTRRSGYTNNFLVVIECCKTDMLFSRRAHWLNEGYEEQNKADSTTTTIYSKQRFLIESTNPAMQLYSDGEDSMIEFHPKLENYHIFNMSLFQDESVTTGLIKITKMKKVVMESNVSYERTDTVVASLEMSLYKFHPDMLSEMENKEFMGYHFMVQLQKDLGDKWFRILLLMGVNFTTIEDTFRRNHGHLVETINGLLLAWKDSNQKRADRGLPRLLAALKRGDRWPTANNVRIQLRGWHRKERNLDNEFHRWLTTAYRDTSLFDVVDVYPEPMSDIYLVMLAGDIEPSAEFFQALDVPPSVIDDVTNKRDVYVTDEMVVMKMFVYFRDGVRDQTKALQRLVQVFDSRKMADKRKYAIMSTEAWLRRASDRNDTLKFDLQDFLNTLP